MTGVITRILLRYLSGALIFKGLMSPEDGLLFSADPDVAAMVDTAIGAGIAAATEFAYYLARRLGWSK
jgi:hypothetical protein